MLIWGDLASRLKGRLRKPERGVSRGHTTCQNGGKGRTKEGKERQTS